mmetsp:Transcript_19848/g.79090  ORF Transcript_19848/g.79090 Transcript_19848/m.79090 type:complete len:331 (+) Transcript_19848:1495-2487(+)
MSTRRPGLLRRRPVCFKKVVVVVPPAVGRRARRRHTKRLLAAADDGRDICDRARLRDALDGPRLGHLVARVPRARRVPPLGEHLHHDVLGVLVVHVVPDQAVDVVAHHNEPRERVGAPEERRVEQRGSRDEDPIDAAGAAARLARVVDVVEVAVEEQRRSELVGAFSQSSHEAPRRLAVARRPLGRVARVPAVERDGGRAGGVERAAERFRRVDRGGLVGGCAGEADLGRHRHIVRARRSHRTHDRRGSCGVAQQRGAHAVREREPLRAAHVEVDAHAIARHEPRRRRRARGIARADLHDQPARLDRRIDLFVGTGSGLESLFVMTALVL